MTRQLTVARNLLLAGLPEDSTVKVYQTRPIIEVTFEQIMNDKLIPDSSVSETIVEWRACATFNEKNSRNRNGEKGSVFVNMLEIKENNNRKKPAKSHPRRLNSLSNTRQ
jgi:hypothetical protein